ncbi:MAG: hypothetical protein ACT4SY_15005 [Hyphomicrobiales bacterium]
MLDRGGKPGGFSFATEAMAGTAASAALRRVRSLADAAPTGRLFAAIATLTDMSRNIEAELEAGRHALDRGDGNQATLHFSRAIVRLDEMAATATPGKQYPAASLPDYLKKRR